MTLLIRSLRTETESGQFDNEFTYQEADTLKRLPQKIPMKLMIVLNSNLNRFAKKAFPLKPMNFEAIQV